MRRPAILLAIVTVVLFGLTGIAFATNPHPPGGTGQPGATCLSSNAMLEPGNSPSSPGSAFNEVNGTAGAVYADGTASGRPNETATSQYDVACFQVSSHP